MIAIIAARQGSKGIPGKNIKELGGKPLLVWSIEAAREAGLTPVVSSDSEDYLLLAKGHGAKVVLRPAELAQDDSPHLLVVQHVLDVMDCKDEAVVILQPTAPFRNKNDILKSVEWFFAGGYDSVFWGVQVPDKWHPDEVMQERDGEIKMASGVPVKDRKKRRQDYDRAWVPSGGCYIVRTKNLKAGNLYGDRVGIYAVAPSPNINTAQDFEEAIEFEKTWKTKERE